MLRAKIVLVALAIVLMLSVTVARATVMSVAKPESGMMPVLVTIGISGKVTDVLPTERLKPSLTRLLRENLQEMVTAPARISGRNVRSQVVFRMRLNAVPRTDGNYDIRFVAVDSTPVPIGNWYWLIRDGRYALADYQSYKNYQDRYPGRLQERNHRDFKHSPLSSPQRLPPMQSAPSPAIPKSQTRN